MQWIEGDVQTPNGKVHVACNQKEIRVKSDEGTGTLRFKSASKPVCKGAEVKQTGDKQYEMTILKGQEVVVKYKNVE
jgi:predicted ribosome-associated RNA-binding protein Tma20